MRSRSSSTTLVTLLLAAALTAACSDASAPQAPAAEARDWPQGTVLAVDDLPIRAEEVDAASVWVERVDRKASPDHLRRLALTNVVLPEKLAQLLAPEAHAKALADARKALTQLRDGTWIGPADPDGALGDHRTGGFEILGLAVWGCALDLADGQWSEPIESGGQVLLVRRLGLTDAPVPLSIEVDVDVLAFPFLDQASADAQIEAAYDRFRLTVVDPAWRPLVPELLQYRMGVHS